MTPSQLATLLALMAALMHASWNAVVKASGDRVATMAALDTVALFSALLLVPFFAPPAAPVWGLIGLSMAVNLAYRFFLLRAYRVGDFGQVYPLVRGLPPLLVAAIAAFWFGERLSAPAVLGIGLVSAGILSLLHGHGHWPATVAALAAGLCTALYTVIDAQGVRQSDSALQYAVYLTLVLSLPVPALTAARRGPALFKQLRRQWRPALFGGFTYTAAYALVLVAMRLDAVAKVAALRESSVIIAAVIATVVFKERFGLRRGLAALLVAVGIGVIKLG
ncbi:EamA family transporter [Pseudomonas typographi]|uniref:EamA family transporter n=1 Tax=Pseudomonas typographi TaxID=2715964 RepID=UPI001687C34B|nr:EamA family transporter [Pseudomonas typographi]MBD1554745.1 EamA family transporter [Pseudomonas typographi]MBD1589091.1 EamA family transporter [Pseudomonas typographi]